MRIYNDNINILDYLSTLDWLILAVTSCITIALIIYGNKKSAEHKSPAEYILMGRQLTLPFFVATLVVTWYGGIMGVTQIAFEQGIYNFFTQGVFWYLTYIIFALYFVKKIRSYGAKSLPELVQNIYGKRSAKLTALFVFCKTLPVSYAISIGLVIQMLLPVSLLVAVSIGVILVAIYASIGGLRAIVYSNTAQFFLMCLGLGSVAAFSVYEFGGLEFLRANLPDTHFKANGTHSFSTMFVWFFIACSATFINPAFYQRCFAAKTSNTATIGILLSTAVWIFFDLCTTFGAMYARAVIPEADSLYAYITYSIQLLPHGFKGLLIASIIATVISTLDAFLLISSNILQYEAPVISKGNKFIATGITAILTIVIASFFDGHIERVWFLYKSYFSACLLVPIIFGYFIPKLAKDSVFYTSGILSCVLMTYWEIFNKSSSIDSFYIGCITSIVVFIVYNFTLEARITMLIERKRRII